MSAGDIVAGVVGAIAAAVVLAETYELMRQLRRDYGLR
jgi:hypothetical protein